MTERVLARIPIVGESEWTLTTLQYHLQEQLSSVVRLIEGHQTAHRLMHEDQEARLRQMADARRLANALVQAGLESRMDRLFAEHERFHELIRRHRDERDQAATRAQELAAAEVERWRAHANEWRGAMNDRERALMPRALSDQQFAAVSERIADLLPRFEARLEPLLHDLETLKLSESRDRGSQAMAMSIFAGIIALSGLLLTALRLWK